MPRRMLRQALIVMSKNGAYFSAFASCFVSLLRFARCRTTLGTLWFLASWEKRNSAVLMVKTARESAGDYLLMMCFTYRFFDYRLLTVLEIEAKKKKMVHFIRNLM